MLLIVRCICICLYRKGLERNGIAKAERAEKPQSGVKGVTWHLQTKSWKVSLRINDKQLHGGYFKPKDSTLEEVERARLAALESRRKLEEKNFTMIEKSEAYVYLYIHVNILKWPPQAPSSNLTPRV